MPLRGAPNAATQPQQRRWYEIKARGNKTAEISIYDDIGGGWFSEGVTAKQFAADLKALGDVSALEVRINSLGGIVNDGLTIYRLLVEHEASVTTIIDGTAASIASVIAMAGDEIIMAESSTMMIHEAWGGMFGTADEFESYAKIMRLNNDIIAKIYADRTGNSIEQVKSWMSSEPANLGLWMDAQTALERGFATSIAENAKMAAQAMPLEAAREALRAKMRALGLHGWRGGAEGPAAPSIDAKKRPHYDALAARVREASLRTIATSLRKQDN